MEKIKVYLIARIAESEHRRNEELCGMLDQRFEVFIPHQHNPYNLAQRKISRDVAEFDYNKIDDSDVGLIREPFGLDCSAESGYFHAKGKPLVLYIENEGTWQDTWMVKHAITAFVFPNQNIADRIRQDETLKNVLMGVVQTPQELSDFVYEIAKTYQR